MSNCEKNEYLKALKQLVVCFQSFEKFSNQHFNELGLTSPQFDIIATLGNTNGINCKELGEKTFITKGTMTGVLDRLEQRGLLTRGLIEGDRRGYLIKLTTQGQELFEKVFPLHIEYMKKAFDHMGEDTIKQLEQSCFNANLSFSHFINK